VTLALKYRPKTFVDVVGQPIVVDVLRNVISEGLKYRAFVFSGVWGSGKTSCARIFGKAVNCPLPIEREPCLECSTCKGADSGDSAGSYLEIDGATYGSIDSIRRVQELMQYRPLGGRYTVVVIDEAHQLSTQAWNSCLKMIEEPPEHAIFVFVTTAHDRIPETIRSRCLDIRFGRIGGKEVTDRLSKICADEGIEAEEGTLQLIVDHTQGIMRDAVTVLEQFSILGGKKIGVSQLEKYLDLAYAINPGDLIKAVLSKDHAKVKELVGAVVDTNGDVVILARKLVSFLRGYWMFKNGVANTLNPGIKEVYTSLNLDLRLSLCWQEALILFISKAGYDRGLTVSLFQVTLGKLML